MLLLKILAVILLVVFGLIFLLLLLLSFAVHIYVEYDDEIKLNIRYLFYSKKILPDVLDKKPKKKRESTQKKVAAEKKEPKENAILNELKSIIKEEGVLGAIDYIKSLIMMFSNAFKKVVTAFIIKKFDLIIIVANEDAAQTATNYGAICAGVYPAFATLSSFIKVKNHRIAIEPNFLQDSTSFTVKAHCYIRPIVVLPAVIKLFISYINLTDRDVQSYAEQAKRNVESDSKEIVDEN